MLTDLTSPNSTILNPVSSIQDPAPATLDFKPRRKRGPQSKIAQLPGHQRMLVNQLLGEDKTYEEIVQEMAKLGVQLNTDNISKWYTGPYQEYLAALDWQDGLHQLRDHAYSFTPDGDVRFQEGVVQIGLTQVFRDIKQERFKDDPANSLRLLNSLARLSREALVIRKYSDEQAKEKAQELRKLDPNRKISQAEETAMQDRSDDFFGFKSASRIQREMDLAATALAPARSISIQPPVPDADFRSRGNEAQISTLESPLPSAGDAQPAVNPSPASGLPFAICNLPSQTAPPKPDEGGAALINTPIHRGESARPDEATVSTVSEPATPQSDPHAHPLTNSLIHSFAKSPSTTPSLHNSITPSEPASLTNSLTHSITNSPAPELCYSCGLVLPPLKPDGTRPSNVCPGCSIRLYPPGTTFDHCPVCEDFAPIFPDGQRVSSGCLRCGQMLPPPGRRYLTCCPGCGIELQNFNQLGERITERCRGCHAPLQLLEPIPAAPQSDAGGSNTSPPSQSECATLSPDGQSGSVQKSKIEDPPAPAQTVTE